MVLTSFFQSSVSVLVYGGYTERLLPLTSLRFSQSSISPEFQDTKDKKDRTFENYTSKLKSTGDIPEKQIEMMKKLTMIRVVKGPNREEFLKLCWDQARAAVVGGESTSYL